MKTEYQLLNCAKNLSKIYRSITGSGTIKVLKFLKKELPMLKIKSVPTGFKAFDWVVPKEWNVKDAYILNNKKKIIDFYIYLYLLF